MATILSIHFSQASDSPAMEPTKLSEDLKDRIRTLEHLSPDDWRRVLRVLLDKSREQDELQPSFLTALNVRITYDLVNALQRMDETSAGLTSKLVFLTRVLVICTVALLIEPATYLIRWILKLY